MATILPAIQRSKQILVGLEYLYETITPKGTPNLFFCVLCDAQFDNHFYTFQHLVSFQHRVDYLKLNYPSTMRPALRLLEAQERSQNPSEYTLERVEFICSEITKHVRRMGPFLKKEAGIQKLRQKQLKFGVKKMQTNETFLENTFLEDDIERELESLGCGHSNVFDFGRPSNSHDQQSDQRSYRMTQNCQRSEDFDPQVIAEYRNRYADMHLGVLQKQQQYLLDPHSHPQYPVEWDMFWNEQSRKCNNAGVSAYGQDFTREWSVHWAERVKQLDMEMIGRREKEIRFFLNLPDDMEIPIVEKALQNMVNQHNKRPGQFDNLAEHSKRSKTHYDEDFRLPNSDMCHTLQRQETPNRYSQNDERHVDRERHGFRAESQDFDQQPSSSNYDEDNSDEAVTIISVLRVLAAFEDLLGNSLGPKVVDLLSKALAMDKVRPNLSVDLLMSEDNNVLLDTVKEKMKGLLQTGFVNTAQVPAVRKVIADVDNINQSGKLPTQSNTKHAFSSASRNFGLAKAEHSEPNVDGRKVIHSSAVNQKSHTIAKPNQAAAYPPKVESRQNVYNQLETTMYLQGKRITPEQLDSLTDEYAQRHTENDTPYLFGLQMGHRFPQQLPSNAQHHQSSAEFPNDDLQINNFTEKFTRFAGKQASEYGNHLFDKPASKYLQAHKRRRVPMRKLNRTQINANNRLGKKLMVLDK